MEFTLKINCDNDAFYPPNCEGEVARIVAQLAYDIMTGDADMNRVYPFRDINGNNIGSAQFVGKTLK